MNGLGASAAPSCILAHRAARTNRPALSEDEWPALRTAVNAIFRPDGGDLTRDYPLLFDPGNRENLRVIVDTPAEAKAPGRTNCRRGRA